MKDAIIETAADHKTPWDDLNNKLDIVRDSRDHETGGGASHEYVVTHGATATEPGEEVARVQFQHGPRDKDGSVDGCTDQVLVAILLDRYRAFQAGGFACRENALVITKLEEALHWMQHRALERHRRGVLGKLEA